MTFKSLRTTRSIFVLATALAIAACQDGPVAPETSAVDGVELPPNLRVTAVYGPDHQSADITVSPSGGWFVLGPHAIHFPKRSICELDSSYGPTEWDKPCQPARRPVQFHVEMVRDAEGRSWLDFTPAARFVPRKRVVLYMTGSGDAAGSAGSGPPILWSPAIGVPGVDESLADPSLRTQYLPRTNIAYRRIKHFSGYNLGVGFADDPNLGDPPTESGDIY